MSLTVEETRALANAYRACIDEGARELANDPVEQMFLRAAVAESAAKVSRFLHERVANGDLLAEPIDNLVPVLHKGDRLGNTLSKVQDGLYKKASSMLIEIVLGGTALAWVGSVLGIIAIYFLSIYGAGFTVGTAFLTGAIPGTILYVAFRIIHGIAPSLAKFPGAVWADVSSLGVRAERMTARCIQPAADAIGAKGISIPTEASRNIGRARGLAQALIFVSWGILAVVTLIFVIGIIDAMTATSTPQYMGISA